ncbi:efflux RND transporter periplasmic adaptor subunit [Methylocystis sp. SB2]|uniref:efflux RND transporter periplasmic adaptor subunit n=1 Tax=Methylocystis sp. (strain SB2) TaxID=743836 RepID=UPI0003F53C65|nr:efflux RND transporter periplasmic adaptor subunit [Methylocystis sp. SB2]ULO24870.1 efflux RND transporter periplasmic adaptor subunit [Methylocystis sp. SB2]
MSRISRRVLLAAGALALAGALAWAYQTGRLPGFAAKDQGPVAGRSGGGRSEGTVTVTATKARLDDVPVTIDAVGTVQALNTVTIRTQVDGRLMRLAFTEGQDVRKGDILAEIDPALYQAQYDQAVAKRAQDEANLANARVDLARYERLLVGAYASKQQHATQKASVAQLEALVRADKAAIDNAKTTLDYATIRSPIDGRVGIRLVDVGNILHASDQTGIVVITQLKPIYVVFTLPQQALPAVQKAQGKAKVSALGPDNATPIEIGELTVIDNQIDQQTGTVRLKATFANPKLALWPGQFVNVRLMLDTMKNVLVAPSQAVQRGPNGAFVYVLGPDNVATMRPVTTGRQDETIAVVTSGIAPGDILVTSGFSRLSDGAKVRVMSAPETANAEKSGGAEDERGAQSDGAPARAR